MNGTVYILRDSRGRFYVGSTENLSRRLRQHRNRHTQTTRNMKVPRLVFQQEFSSLQEARAMERRIKRLKRKDYIEKIVKDGYIRMTL